MCIRDRYQLHWPERRTNFFGKKEFKYSASDPWQDNFLGILETMKDLIKQGKIRHFGISNETPWGFSKFLHLSEKHDLPKVQTVQNPYSLLNRTYEIGMSEISIREKAGLIAYSPMGFGMLSGKFHKGTDKPTDRINRWKNYNRYSSEISKKATADYLAIAEANGMTLAEMALAFVSTRPFVTATIIGATSMTQLKENIGSIKFDISKELLKEITTVHQQYSNPAP